MRRFSETFDYFLKQKKMTITQISRISGIDRSTLYQYQRDKRIPPGEERVRQIAACLRLNRAETEKLLDSFMVSQIGEYTYTSRKQLSQMLQVLSDWNRRHRRERERAAVGVPESGGGENPSGGSEMYFDGSKTSSHHPSPAEEETQKAPAVREIIGRRQLTEEMRKLLRDQSESCPLCIAEPLISENTFALIADAVSEDPSCHIRHLIMLNSIEQIAADDAVYNLRFLTLMLPLLLTEHHYVCRYMYGDVQTIGEEKYLKPDFMVSRHHVLLYDSRLQEGLLITDSQAAAYYRGRFMEAAAYAPRFNRTNSLSDAVRTFAGERLLRYTLSDTVYFFDAGICLALVLDPDEDGALIERLDAGKVLEKSMLQSYLDYVRQCRKLAARFRVIFTLQGIEYFCESGHLVEVFQQNEFPLPPAMRLLFLRRWRELALAGQVRMLEMEEFSGSVNTTLTSTRQALSLDMPLSFGHMLTSSVEENSIVNNVYDFLEDAFRNKTQEPEKTAAFLEEKIQQMLQTH